MTEFPELKEKLRIVIFCGGYGTRMWPMSRKGYAKQFQPLLGENSFLEETIARVKLKFKPEDIYFAVPIEQAGWVKKQAKGIPLENIIPEPERRDNLGAVGLATAFLDKHFPNSLMAVVWGADHIVKDSHKFNHLLELAARICQTKDVICAVDVKPTYPATAVGWIKIGKLAGLVDRHPVYEFIKHIEKPKLELAQKLFASNKYLINTGYYVWRTSTMLGFYQKFAPVCYGHLKTIQKSLGTDKQTEVLKREYHQIEKNSIDFGLFEKLPTESMLVMEGDFGFYDVGTWDLLYEALAVGQRENITKGEVEFIEAKGNLVYLPKDKAAAVIGVDGLIVVDTKDGLLVCRRGRGGEVKKFIELLKNKNKLEYL